VSDELAALDLDPAALRARAEALVARHAPVPWSADPLLAITLPDQDRPPTGVDEDGRPVLLAGRFEGGDALSVRVPHDDGRWLEAHFRDGELREAALERYEDGRLVERVVQRPAQPWAGASTERAAFAYDAEGRLVSAELEGGELDEVQEVERDERGPVRIVADGEVVWERPPDAPAAPEAFAAAVEGHLDGAPLRRAVLAFVPDATPYLWLLREGDVLDEEPPDVQPANWDLPEPPPDLPAALALHVGDGEALGVLHAAARALNARLRGSGRVAADFWAYGCVAEDPRAEDLDACGVPRDAVSGL
jgi:hypothetical protein